MMRLRINRIIKKAIKQTVTDFKESTPAIYQYFFYGAVNIAPQYLVIWYLFETDEELQSAKNSGLCDELVAVTMRNLISLGYPKEAFSDSSFSQNNRDKVIFENASPEQAKSFFDMLSNQKARISFTTKEDIDKKANGDYHLYFQ